MILFSLVGRHIRPSVNPVIRIVILSDLLFWSAWSTVLPLLSVFTLSEIPRSSIQSAAAGYSLYIAMRIIGSTISGLLFSRYSPNKKVAVLIVGILMLNVSYVGFAFFKTLTMFYLFYAVIGIGVGLATPIREALFSTHLDKDRETTEWATLESVIFLGIALCALTAGYIISVYGFSLLFLLAAAFNTASAIPYFIYKRSLGQSKT